MTLFKNEKFEATGETKEYFGVTLYRIRAVRDIISIGVTAGMIGGWVQCESNLQVYGDAWVYGNAWVSPIVLHGLTWVVTISDHQMVIGCQEHDIDHWFKFTDTQIAKMDIRALEFWNAHKAILQALCTSTGRPFAKEVK